MWAFVVRKASHAAVRSGAIAHARMATVADSPLVSLGQLSHGVTALPLVHSNQSLLVAPLDAHEPDSACFGRRDAIPKYENLDSRGLLTRLRCRCRTHGIRPPHETRRTTDRPSREPHAPTCLPCRAYVGPRRHAHQGPRQPRRPRVGRRRGLRRRHGWIERRQAAARMTGG